MCTDVDRGGLMPTRFGHVRTVCERRAMSFSSRRLANLEDLDVCVKILQRGIDSRGPRTSSSTRDLGHKVGVTDDDKRDRLRDRVVDQVRLSRRRSTRRLAAAMVPADSPGPSSHTRFGSFRNQISWRLA
jgi:hypothetical protein